MSSNKVLDKTGLTYLWSKFIAYLENIFPAIGNSDMKTEATTVTGAIAEHSDKIGSTAMGTTATTLTGAIAEHEQDLSDLDSNKIDKTAIANNLTTTASGYVLDARQGKTLNDKLSITRFDIPRSSSISGGSCFGIYDKASGTVRIYMYFSNSSAISSNTTLFTVPSSYRPSSAVAGPLFYNSTGNSGAYLFVVNTDGTIKQTAGSTILSGIGVVEYSI